MNGKIFWLKLPKNFFESKQMRFLAKEALSHQSQICFIKLMLVSIDNDGIIEHSGVLPSLLEEIAIEIDEDVSIVRECLMVLARVKLIEIDNDNARIYIEQACKMVGSETQSASRVRAHRERKLSQGKQIQSFTDELQAVTDELQCNENCYEETRDREEKEKEVERDKKRPSKLRSDWTPNKTALDLCKKKELDIDFVLAKFKNYWMGPNAKDGGYKICWDATFLNWVKREEKSAYKPTQPQENYTKSIPA